MTVKVHFTGIPQSILKGRDLEQWVERVAVDISANLRGQGIRVEGDPGDIELPVKVDVYEADGQMRASVVIAHPSGLAVQGKDGALTRAAAEAGLEVVGE